MSVTQYVKDGKTLWQIYIDLRSRKHRRIRVQKRTVGFESEKETQLEEKRLLRELTEKLARLEAQGLTWSETIDRWVSQQTLYPTERLAPETIQDYEAVLRNWTAPWLYKVASQLNRADGREVLRNAREQGRSARFCRGLKYTINKVYNWGIEERHITGVQTSPVHGILVEPDREEKRPEILTVEQIRELLRAAREQEHPWYPIWVMAVFTGCRSGELHQLRRSDVEIPSREQGLWEDQKPAGHRRYGSLYIRRGWNVRSKQAGPTKAGYWRTVPVSSELYWFLMDEMRIEQKAPDALLLPRHWEWDKGEQARILRTFCIGNGLPSVRFHTLRACFATQLIGGGVPPSLVMKVCGWRDLKTMQRYIRLSGVDEQGATERLRFLSSGESAMEKAVELYDGPKP